MESNAGDAILTEDGSRVLNEETITSTTGALDKILLEDGSSSCRVR